MREGGSGRDYQSHQIYIPIHKLAATGRKEGGLPASLFQFSHLPTEPMDSMAGGGKRAWWFIAGALEGGKLSSTPNFTT